MATFVAPIDPAAGWTLTTPGVLDVPTPPAAAPLRYSGLSAFALQAERATATAVSVPAPAIVRVATLAPGPAAIAVEAQLNPFALRATAAAIRFGVPTFYFLFAAATTVALDDSDAAAAGDILATVRSVQILCVGQDRIARDPALWSAEILAAISPGERGPWAAFADAVAQQTASGPNPPVLLLDHRGLPRGDGTAVQLVSGPDTATITLVDGDGGDLQRAVARMHAADPQAMPLASVFDASGTATLRPLPGDGDVQEDVQLARLENPDQAGATSAGEMAITPQTRHVSFTDLGTWFDPQTATGLADGHLRYTRGNKLTPFVNGPSYYDVLFGHLNTASGLHLIGGWATFPDVALTRPADATVPVTLVDAATAIGGRGGQTRFLSPKFIQLEEGSPIETTELLLIAVVIVGLLRFKGVDFIRSDAGGAVILVALFVINAIAVTWLVDTNGQALEPSKDAVELLAPVDGALSTYGPYPATVADNPAAPPTSSDVFTTLFKTDRHFGIYHQKLALVLDGGTHYGYCGGIDLNPNRVDDSRHLALEPFHDVHTEVLGPAVRELELSFAERWRRDGGGSGLAFEPAPASPPPAPPPGPQHAVQVARTYFAAADPTRALEFATHGDDTIRRTLLRAIRQAREFIMIEDQYFTPPEEYTQALVDKVAGREINTLVIVLTGVTDQPFGETVRSGAISRLMAADPSGDIVRVGYLRRHYTLPDNELRASSGRLLLMGDLGDGSGGGPDVVLLGPKVRLPQPPFWFAIDGELMYAFDHAAGAPPPYGAAFQIVRGPDTRLIKGGPVGVALGPRTRAHKTGAAATVVDLAGIYVHSKLTIVDDVFMSIGSANVDRRGFYHDGEIQVFSVPEQLKIAPDNPVAALRRQIWAEVLDLPAATAGPLLEDPLAAAALFDRSPLLGNRFTGIDAYPAHLMFDATGGDGLVTLLIKLAVGAFATFEQDNLYNGIVDPTSSLDPQV